jgi:hypothetical protein
MLFPNFVFFVCFVVKNNERTFDELRRTISALI